MNTVKNLFADALALLFPQLCQACGQSLMANEKVICTTCIYELPYTNFHQQTDHIIARQFWGKLPLQVSFSLLYFTKGGMVQTLMHNLKYRNAPQIGYLLGKLAGQQLAQNQAFKTIDYIIPVPLHPSRLRKRGYNQSEFYAKGIADKLGCAVKTKNLVRKRATETQTHKGRLARFENMKSVFVLKNAEEIAGKHILLVDDIMTTGSTLEACGLAILNAENVQLSIATIAYVE